MKLFYKIKFYLSYINNHDKPLKLILGYILLATGLHNLIMISKNNYKIKFSKNVLALNNFLDSSSRSDEELIIQSLMVKKGIFIDVGSNIGTISLAVSTTFKDAQIFSFEANPTTYKNFLANLKLNKSKNISPFSIALGEENRFIQFEDRGTDDQNGVLENKTVKKSIKVEMKRMDDIFLFPSIRLIKIDVEGYELFVLKGAIENLKICEAIFFEFSQSNYSKYGYSGLKILEFLNNLGFKIYLPTISSNGKIIFLNFEPSNVTHDVNLVATKNINNF